MLIFKKIIHVLNRTVKELRTFPKYVRDFGIMTSLYVAYDHIFLRPKSKRYIKTIYNSTEKILEPVLQDFELKEVFTKKKISKIPIFVCWLQGEEHMPELVSMCYEQLIRMTPPEAEVKLITLKNYREYVDINPILLRKYKEGIISNAFFADILRYHLLRDYGGMWIDATIYVSSPIKPQQLNANYYTMRMHQEMCPHEACEGKWTNFCFAGKSGNPIFQFVCEALDYYRTNIDLTPDYVLLDYILMVGYNHFSEIRKLVDSVPYNNEFVWELKALLEDEWSEQIYSEITSKNMFHKLAHQKSYIKTTSNGNDTFYGHLCKK